MNLLVDHTDLDSATVLRTVFKLFQNKSWVDKSLVLFKMIDKALAERGQATIAKKHLPPSISVVNSIVLHMSQYDQPLKAARHMRELLAFCLQRGVRPDRETEKILANFQRTFYNVPRQESRAPQEP